MDEEYSAHGKSGARTGLAALWHNSLVEGTSPFVTDVMRLQERVMASVQTGITIADAQQPDCPVVYCNPAFTHITGYHPHDVLGRNCRFLQGADTDPEAVALLRQAVKEGVACAVTFKNYKKDGTPFWNELMLTPLHDEAGRLVKFIGVQHDVTRRVNSEATAAAARLALEQSNLRLEERVKERTEALVRANEQLRHEAFHDGLTGLANRSLFYEHLQHAVARDQRVDGRGFAVLYLDLDRFKVINDSLGHSVGDRLLIDIGKRLTACMRPGDLVARLGGDEFAILLEDLTENSEAIVVVERLQRQLARFFQIGKHRFTTSASIGVVGSSWGYSNADEMIRDADLTMYGAKAQGKGRHLVFQPEMRQRTLSIMTLETDLRAALLSGNQFRVFYQPIIEARSDVLVGFEALVRWEHPALGMVSPGEFIPLAEETGLVVELDRWVLRQACNQLKVWQRTLGVASDLSMSVNLSAQQLDQEDFVSYLETVLEASEVRAEHLKLELTEALMIAGSENVQGTLEHLKALGVELLIDDFGTGFSSLSYLHQLPADTLKIDRSFIDRLLTSRDGNELVRTIISMAHNLGLKVVAEGVESAAQLERLKAYACDFAQGYFVSRPVDVNTATAYLQRLQNNELERSGVDCDLLPSTIVGR